MTRKKAPWMIDSPTVKKYPIVSAVLPWRGDGRYKLDQATRVYGTRHPVEVYAAKDVAEALVVREIYLDSNQETVLALFRKAYVEDAPNLDRQKERPPRELTGLKMVVDEDTGEAYISNDQEEFYQIRADPK